MREQLERIRKARESIAENRRLMAESPLVTDDMFKASEDEARAHLAVLEKQEQALQRGDNA